PGLRRLGVRRRQQRRLGFQCDSAQGHAQQLWQSRAERVVSALEAERRRSHGLVDAPVLRRLRRKPARLRPEVGCAVAIGHRDCALAVSSRARASRWPGASFLPSRATLPSKDRKSTRLNSSHVKISYAVFCLKKKKQQWIHSTRWSLRCRTCRLRFRYKRFLKNSLFPLRTLFRQNSVLNLHRWHRQRIPADAD